MIKSTLRAFMDVLRKQWVRMQAVLNPPPPARAAFPLLPPPPKPTATPPPLPTVSVPTALVEVPKTTLFMTTPLGVQTHDPEPVTIDQEVLPPLPVPYSNRPEPVTFKENLLPNVLDPERSFSEEELAVMVNELTDLPHPWLNVFLTRPNQFPLIHINRISRDFSAAREVPCLGVPGQPLHGPRTARAMRAVFRLDVRPDGESCVITLLHIHDIAYVQRLSARWYFEGKDGVEFRQALFEIRNVLLPATESNPPSPEVRIPNAFARPTFILLIEGPPVQRPVGSPVRVRRNNVCPASPIRPITR